MSKRIQLTGFILWLCLAANIQASNSVFTFDTAAEQQRFYSLTQELRCLVCQNQSLADSNATLAQDLRLEIAKQIQNGATDEQIIDYLVQRYGEFVLYRPRWQPNTYILWLTPWVLLAISLGGFLLRRKRLVKQGGAA